MLGFDRTITIYNKCLNEETGYDKYFATIVVGVSWFGKHITAHGDKSFARQNVYQIRIPEGAETPKTFVPPKEYTDPSTQFTFEEGDKIVLGAIDIAMERGDALDGYDNVCTVTTYHDNRRIGLKHLYVEGV